jgi:hypothetical protein
MFNVKGKQAPSLEEVDKIENHKTNIEFKEEEIRIDELKYIEWIDVKIKTIEGYISNNNRPKMVKIVEYWL